MFSGFLPPFWSGADYGRKCIENYSNSGVFCVYPVRTSKLGKSWEFRHPHVKVQSYALLLSHQSANLANYNTVNSANYLIPLYTISRGMSVMMEMRDERRERSFYCVSSRTRFSLSSCVCRFLALYQGLWFCLIICISVWGTLCMTSVSMCLCVWMYQFVSCISKSFNL